MRLWNAGIAAAVAAAGIWMCVSGPEQALAAKTKATSAASADRPIVLSKFKKRQAQTTKKSRTAQSRHVKKAASKTTIKKTVAKFAEEKPSAKEIPPGVTSKPALSPSVANARAEALADDEARNIAALDSTDVVSTKDGIQIAAADQLNDADRALTDNPTTAQTPPAVAAEVAAPVSSPRIIRATSSGERQSVKTGDDDPWNKTSLIGKIFIAFGSLLTLASAARLIIA